MNRRALQTAHLLSLICAIFISTIFEGTELRAQEIPREDEIVANLAGGRVIVHVARETIVFAAIDQPIEAKAIPPRAVNLDVGHVGILLGASEWQLPADPKPVRLDRNIQHIATPDAKFQQSGEAEPDLESIGVAFLEKLRPLVTQLHHKVELAPDEPLLQIVVLGFAPDNYGPEVWVVEYRMEQEQVATRGEYWQTRLLRPRFTQLYPPEKHAPRTPVESRYPPEMKGPTFLELIQGNDPRISRLGAGEPRFAKVLEAIDKGQAQKAVAIDAADFLRAALPLIAPNAGFFLGTMEEQRGFSWIVPPDEPIEKAKEDKDRPPEAPSLRRKPNPSP
jgi:hypothetical protein